MTSKPSEKGARALLAFVWLYAALLGLVMLVRYGIGDRTSWSFATNALLLYAYLPLPIVVILAAVRRDRLTIAIASLSTILFVWQWGALFVSTNHAHETNARTLRVMTYNALGYNPDTAGTIRVARDAHADIVALQELAPEHAAALERAFSDQYPYRFIDARDGVAGCGILSRYPLRKIEIGPLERIPWIGTPMAVEIDVSGQHVHFVNFHTYAGPSQTSMRREQALALAEFASTHTGSLIFAGDLNATDQNEVHTIIARTMHDAWRDAGFGFGHTFPGKPTPDSGGSRPVLFGMAVPMWLVRIDYIFHSDAFVAIDARLGPDDAGSDHRALIATLAMRSSEPGK